MQTEPGLRHRLPELRGALGIEHTRALWAELYVLDGHLAEHRLGHT
ncbi:MAG: hypothetical protein IPG17_20660 [Sandaracinaceae bacterium]|nr:hypothetical protein [Sandaracinaceae bacterium]